MEDDPELMRGISGVVLYVRIYQALFAAMGNDFTPAELHRMAIRAVIAQTGTAPVMPD